MKNYFDKISELDRVSKGNEFINVDITDEKYYFKVDKTDIIDECNEVKEAIAYIQGLSSPRKYAYQPVRIKYNRK